MDSRISNIIKHYQELSKDMETASLHGDSASIQRIAKEMGELSPINALALKAQILSEEITEAESIITDETEQNAITFYQDIIDTNSKELELITSKILTELETKDPNDTRNAILEIRAGTGGEEAALFAGDLYHMYLKYAEKQGWDVEQLSSSEANQGGIKEVITLIKGNGVFGQLKLESGVHRVQRIPSTEASGRIHTSSASVVILPEVEDSEVEINEDDLKIDLFRAGGPGGQSVNTTDSAVRITHLPTGLMVACQDERSQLKNKLRALSILKSRLYDLQKRNSEADISSQRRIAIKSGDRSDKIKTYNFPQSRMTDHRIKRSWFNLSEILQGELDEILETTKQEISSVDDTHEE